MRYILIVAIILSFLNLADCAQKKEIQPNTAQSFLSLVEATGWELGLKDFAIHLEKEGNVFVLRMEDSHYIRYEAYPKSEKAKRYFAPLQKEHLPELAALLEYALFFAGQKRNTEFALRLNWELYPQSILGWAKVWQHSELRKRQEKRDAQQEYQQLMGMIADYVSAEMEPITLGLGFEPNGASMEKMSYPRAGRLKYYKDVLEPAGVPADLKIPIPLFLSLKLKPAQDKQAEATSQLPISVDSLFVIAKAKSITVYATFQRAFDEYEITGAEIQPDGTYARIRPMSQSEYYPIAGKLLRGCLKATKGNERKTISLRLDLSLYPKVYDEVVQGLTSSTLVMQKDNSPRPGLPYLQFFKYKPSPVSGFHKAMEPFLEKNGYHLKYLQISVETQKKDKNHPEHEKRFKALGVEPDKPVTLPDIVYMVVEKN